MTISSTGNTGKASSSCSLDLIANSHRSVQSIVQNRRRCQQQLGKNIARRRLLENVNHNNNNHSENNNKNAVLSFHGHIQGDLYTNSESPQYCACSFLDGHDIIMAASVRGEIDVLKLPRTNTGTGAITKLAGKIRLRTEQPGSSHFSGGSARYKLKSLDNGNAFAVGSPSGEFNVFATEHSTTWSSDGRNTKIPCHFSSATSVLQDPLHHNIPSNSNNDQNNQPWRPYITRNWRTNVLGKPDESFYMGINLSSEVSMPIKSWIQPTHDALWDFLETPSGLLAAHVKQEFRRLGRQIRILDSRNKTDAGALSHTLTTDDDGRSTSSPEIMTAICFASGFSLMTAHARPLAGKPSNFIQLWDIRKLESGRVWEAPFVGSSIESSSGESGQDFVSMLTSSTPSNGKVMVTSSSHQNKSTVQHYWWDLNRRKIMKAANHGGGGASHTESSFVQQRNRMTTVFATNPSQDFMACYENISGDNFIHFYDWRANKQSASAKAKTSTKAKLVKKRRCDELEEATNCQPASAWPNDTNSDDYKDEELQPPRGIKPKGTFTPKLFDRYGLSTELSCLAVNDSGTSVIGGSFDGDIFAWRGN